MATHALPMASDSAARLAGHPLVLFLDIDGTLSPIAPRPDLAVVVPEMQRVVGSLATTRGVHVVFVTGRAAMDGRRLTGVDDAWVIGNHGLEVAAPREASKARADVAPFTPRIAEAAALITALVAEHRWSGVFAEDKQLTMSVHYRLADRRIVPDLTTEVTRIVNDLGLRVTNGKEVLEIRPPIAANKGTAAVELAEALGALHDGGSILSAGDDRTDEDMFRALRARQPRALTVRVGGTGEGTAAEFSVDDTEEMRELLAALLELRQSIVA